MLIQTDYYTLEVDKKKNTVYAVMRDAQDHTGKEQIPLTIPVPFSTFVSLPFYRRSIHRFLIPQEGKTSFLSTNFLLLERQSA